MNDWPYCFQMFCKTLKNLICFYNERTLFSSQSRVENPERFARLIKLLTTAPSMIIEAQHGYQNARINTYKDKTRERVALRKRNLTDLRNFGHFEATTMPLHEGSFNTFSPKPACALATFGPIKTTPMFVPKHMKNDIFLTTI